jgi:hypothetical protein
MKDSLYDLDGTRLAELPHLSWRTMIKERNYRAGGSATR